MFQREMSRRSSHRWIPGAFALLLALAAVPLPAGEPFRILHIMSFDSPWRWTDGQFAGFKEGLGDVPADFQVFQLDTKRNQTSEARDEKGRAARALIEAWRPDLVYTSDDDALDLVVRHYRDADLPFVFSGVNKNPADYGLDGAKNVTGVLEREHFEQSLRLLRILVPRVERLAVISDGAPHWGPVIERIRSRMAELPDIKLAAVDRVQTFEAFRQRVLAYPEIADAVVYLGIFTLVGQDGVLVPYQEVQRWTVEHSRLPEISFWIDRVHFGVLAAVTVSEREQGLSAGRLARAILVEDKAPSSLRIAPTLKGHPAISLARAKVLGIPVGASLLLSSEVVTGFDWETKPR